MFKKIFLGGTCNESRWRDILIPMLKTSYYNPVVKDWNQAAQDMEKKQKEICDCELFVITPRMKGVFSIAEVVDASNKKPNNTILCILMVDEDSNAFNSSLLHFSPEMLKSLEATEKLVAANGVKVFHSLQDVANYINLPT